MLSSLKNTAVHYPVVGEAESYTDFHIDVSGMSVCFSQLAGVKAWFFVEPTETNLKLFWEYKKMKKNSITRPKIVRADDEKTFMSYKCKRRDSTPFFPDMVHANGGTVNICYTHPGQTLIVPGGWIHAVHTIEDSVATSSLWWPEGNFKLPLQIHPCHPEAEQLKGFEDILVGRDIRHGMAIMNKSDHRGHIYYNHSRHSAKLK